MVIEAGHLGGYVAGGDPATFFPELWKWLVDQGVSSVLDVGCGEGHALRFFVELGCEVLGVDGVPQDDDRIVQHDFTQGPFDPGRDFDLVWSCEFLEHVEERYVPNLLTAFTCAPLILLTHAFPGQDGYHHVNCRDPEYVRGMFAAIGYREDEGMTAVTRSLARANPSPWNHYVRAGLVLRRA